MIIRTIALAASFALLSVLGAAPAASAQDKVFRLVPASDLKYLDPLFTTNYVTRNFAHMVYETLFAPDSQGVPQPQMVDSYSVSDDRLQWTFTLRTGLKFHDGSDVTAADAVASLKRWTAMDSYGRAMTAAGAQWMALDATRFSLTLEKPFGLVLEALAKYSSLPPVIMPERLIKAAGTGVVDDVVGSGPYVFKRDEWVPGNKVVFVRNPHYVGRKEAPSFLAGNRGGQLDRVEWIILPDSNSAAAALINGEVDMIEQVPPDYIETLRKSPDVKILPAGAYQGALVVNQLHPPFDKPLARRALLHAIEQKKFLTAMGYPKDLRMDHCATFFICGGDDSTAGAEPFMKPDLAKAKQLLAASGYKGEKVVVLIPTDFQSLQGAGLVAVQTMKDIGMNVETQSMDWPSLVSRRVKKDRPDAGGWSTYATHGVAASIDSPLNNFMLGAACGNSMPGWPCDKGLDELRSQWMQETDPGKRRDVRDAFQRRAYEVAPYMPLGQFYGATAVRKNIKHLELQTGDVPMAWTFDK